MHVHTANCRVQSNHGSTPHVFRCQWGFDITDDNPLVTTKIAEGQASLDTEPLPNGAIDRFCQILDDGWCAAHTEKHHTAPPSVRWVTCPGITACPLVLDIGPHQHSIHGNGDLGVMVRHLPDGSEAFYHELATESLATPIGTHDKVADLTKAAIDKDPAFAFPEYQYDHHWPVREDDPQTIRQAMVGLGIALRDLRAAIRRAIAEDLRKIAAWIAP